MSQGFLSSVNNNATSWKQMGERDTAILRTELSQMAQTPAGEGCGGLSTTYVTIANTGMTKLADYDEWDVIIQYQDTGGGRWVKWLPYNPSSPGDNEWGIFGIYLDETAGKPEMFEPGILNPGEEIKITVKLNPAIGDNTTNLMTVSTPNGVSASVHFYGMICLPPP